MVELAVGCTVEDSHEADSTTIVLWRTVVEVTDVVEGVQTEVEDSSEEVGGVQIEVDELVVGTSTGVGVVTTSTAVVVR